MTASRRPHPPRHRRRARPCRTPGHSIRTAAAVSLLGVLAFVIASCGGSPPQASQAETGPAAAPAPPARTRLVLLAMQDFIDAGILLQFESETGIGIDHVTYDDPEEVSPRLRSKPGSADIIVADAFRIKDLRELRLLCPLRKETLTNFDNLDPRHLGLPFDPAQEYSIPYHWGTTLIAFRRDLLPDPPKSWRLLWDPALKGRVMMLDDSFESMAVAMILDRIDPQMPKETGYRQAANTLIEHLESMRPRYGTDDEVKHALITGTVAAAMCYSGDAAIAAEENPQVDFFIPDEGAMMWVDCIAICRDTQNAEMAHRFLNFFLRPEIAARNAAVINYAPANLASEALIPDNLKNDHRLYPPVELRAKLQHVHALDEKMETLARRYWHRFRSRLLAAENAQASHDAEHKTRATP